MSTNKRILFAVISGTMVVPFSYLESFGEYSIAGASIIDILIGATFALLVMVPFQKRTNLLRSLLLILASITIYVVVAYLATERYHTFFLDLPYAAGITLSGGLGALLTGIAVALLAPLRLSLLNYIMLTISGFIAGYVFSHTIDSENIFINALGFILWQVGVSVSLSLSKK